MGTKFFKVLDPVGSMVNNKVWNNEFMGKVAHNDKLNNWLQSSGAGRAIVGASAPGVGQNSATEAQSAKNYDAHQAGLNAPYQPNYYSSQAPNLTVAQGGYQAPPPPSAAPLQQPSTSPVNAPPPGQRPVATNPMPGQTVGRRLTDPSTGGAFSG